MANVQFETHVDGLGTIYSCDDSAFDEALEAILKKSDGLITLRDLAYARIQQGKDSSVSQKGSHVREGSLFVPRAANRRIWLRNSLILDNPSVAVEAHRAGGEYLLPLYFNVDRYLEQIGKDNYFLLTDTTPVPTNRFGEDARMQWAFRDLAQQYGQFNADAGIEYFNTFMWNNTVWTNNDNYIDRQGRPFASQLWLRWLDELSDIRGATGLSVNNGVRGVRYEPAESGAQKE
jgi:hypothetical protein